jgi:hypothetical protein
MLDISAAPIAVWLFVRGATLQTSPDLYKCPSSFSSSTQSAIQATSPV